MAQSGPNGVVLRCVAVTNKHVAGDVVCSAFDLPWLLLNPALQVPTSLLQAPSHAIEALDASPYGMGA